MGWSWQQLLLLPAVVSAIPSTPHFFTEQRVDHFGTSEATFSQRYYSSDVHFKGPGHPIFVVIGGEGAVPPSTGLFYPFVVDDLAVEFSALVVQPEHRFYGTSLPFGDSSFSDGHLNLMTAEQALGDTAHFALATQRKHNCSAIRGTRGYCPIVTVGGSYPGWLSAMMRLRYPAVPTPFNISEIPRDEQQELRAKIQQASILTLHGAGSRYGLLRFRSDPHVRAADRSVRLLQGGCQLDGEVCHRMR